MQLATRAHITKRAYKCGLHLEGLTSVMREPCAGRQKYAHVRFSPSCSCPQAKHLWGVGQHSKIIEIAAPIITWSRRVHCTPILAWPSQPYPGQDEFTARQSLPGQATHPAEGSSSSSQHVAGFEAVAKEDVSYEVSRTFAAMLQLINNRGEHMRSSILYKGLQAHFVAIIQSPSHHCHGTVKERALVKVVCLAAISPIKQLERKHTCARMTYVC
eukprot:scaffold20684_cov21-Tisochrysis_lutea.AAC.2